MCSISGFSFTPCSQVNARNLSTALLCAGAQRGDDACGASYYDNTGGITTQTRAMTPKAFTGKTMRMPKGTRTAILHTRYATQGSPKNPLNNHPIERLSDSCDIVSVVHNGVIDNDTALFADYALTRNAQVDSEIVPALLAAFGSESYATTLSEISGSMALAWLDERTPGTLHLAKGLSSPIHFAYIATPPAKKSKAPRIQGVVFASTLSMLEDGLASIGLTLNSKYVRHFEARTGEYTQIIEGEWNGLMYPWTPAKRQSYRDWNSPAQTTSFFGYNDEGTFIGTAKKDTSEYSDYALHMEFCEDTMCEFYADTDCPRYLAYLSRIKRRQPVWEGWKSPEWATIPVETPNGLQVPIQARYEGVPSPSDEVMERIVKAWSDAR